MLKTAVFKDRCNTCTLAVIVVAHRVEHYTGEHTVAHVNFANITAPLFSTLDFNTILGITKIAIPNHNILDAAAHFAAHTDAVAVL